MKILECCIIEEHRREQEFDNKKKWGMNVVKLNVEEMLGELGLSQMHMEDMSVLVTTGVEMDDFMDNYWIEYWIEKDMQFESINAYRANKIDQHPMTYEAFKKLYKDGDKFTALESLFWHKVHSGHVKALERRFVSKTLDLRQVYDWQKENKESRLLGLVLQTTY